MNPTEQMAAIVPGVPLQPLQGLVISRLPQTGFLRIEVHYHVDRKRRRPAWAKAAAARYGGLGIRSWRWRREMEIDFTASSGEMVFPNFDAQVHVVQAFDVPAHWPRWLCYDPGGANPHAMDWWAIDPTPPNFDLYLYRQWYKGLEMPDGTPGGYYVLADVIRIAYQLSVDPDGKPERFEAFLIDPAARKQEALAGAERDPENPSHRGVSLYEELLATVDELGWRVDPSTGNNLKDQALDDIIDRMGNYPVYQEHPDGSIVEDGDGEPVLETDPATGAPVIVAPRLFIMDSCPWMVYELQRYRWKHWKSDEVKKDKNRPEAPVDKNDHSITNLVRLVNWLRRDELFARRVEQARTSDEASTAVQEWRKKIKRGIP